MMTFINYCNEINIFVTMLFVKLLFVVSISTALKYKYISHARAFQDFFQHDTCFSTKTSHSPLSFVVSTMLEF